LLVGLNERVREERERSRCRERERDRDFKRKFFFLLARERCCFASEKVSAREDGLLSEKVRVGCERVREKVERERETMRQTDGEKKSNTLFRFSVVVCVRRFTT